MKETYVIDDFYVPTTGILQIKCGLHKLQFQYIYFF